MIGSRQIRTLESAAVALHFHIVCGINDSLRRMLRACRPRRAQVMGASTWRPDGPSLPAVPVRSRC